MFVLPLIDVGLQMGPEKMQAEEYLKQVEKILKNKPPE